MFAKEFNRGATTTDYQIAGAWDEDEKSDSNCALF